MKEKPGQQDKDTKEGSNLQVAGPAGEITAGTVLLKSYCALVRSWKYILKCYACATNIQMSPFFL